MTELRFTPSSMRSWHSEQQGARTAHVTGWATVGGRVLSAQVLAQHFLDNMSVPDSLAAALHALDGNFAAVLETSDEIALIVDPVRSIPLLFAHDSGVVSVSDDARILGFGERAIDQASAVEFATAAYVTGPHTLFDGISGLQSGEWVVWTSMSAEPARKRYYEYSCSYDSPTSVEGLCEEFDRALIGTFDKLVAGIDGRRVVIPLSGGLDSRLIAAMFSRVGYDNVVCLSYGVPGNRETARSQAVAEILGYEWIYVPYPPKIWQQTFAGPQMREFMSFASNGVSMPFTGDWPALRALRDNPAVPSDAVVVPGHTGDFVCGGHLKYIFDPTYFDLEQGFNAGVMKKHYSLWADLATDPAVRAVVNDRIHDVLGEFPSDTDEDLGRKYEYWEWQERQSKFIVNAVRSYEFFGFSWRIPLWTREVMDFWRRVPIALKMDKFLYRTYLASYDPHQLFQADAPTGLWDSEKVIEERQSALRTRVKGMLAGFGPTAPMLRVRDRLRTRLNEYRTDPLGLATFYPFLQYLFRQPGRRNALSLQVRDFLRSEHDVAMPAPGASTATSPAGRL